MQGLLRKTVQSVSVFQRNIFPVRYFIVDFTQAVIYITHHQTFGKENVKWNKRTKKYVPMTKHEMLEEDQKKIVIPFRSLIDTHSSNNNLPSAACPKDWPFSFSLNTIDR